MTQTFYLVAGKIQQKQSVYPSPVAIRRFFADYSVTECEVRTGADWTLVARAKKVMDTVKMEYIEP